MKQVIQDLKSGDTTLEDMPRPNGSQGSLLIRSLSSIVSLGTEKMLIDFGKGNLIAKARQQPDKVKQVLEKAKTDGVVATYKTVKSKLETSIPLGYSNCGFVLEAPANSGFEVGDLVVSNGPHAEVVSVPINLCAKVPEGVKPEEAACTVIGAIALQGVRLMGPSLGETIVVTGLGLIGQLAIQILRANGCQVIGVDLDERKLELARQFGAETVNLAEGADPVSVAQRLTGGAGVDGVLVTASTRSSEPMTQAAHMCRKRGRIVLVGVTGLELSRADFYEKELSFQVSCSYGPGRYDPNYENKGLDYPIGFVRWTEQRNFEAFLRLLADRKVDVGPLISHRFDFANALEAYETVGEGGAMGIALNYSEAAEEWERIRQGGSAKEFPTSLSLGNAAASPSKVVIGMIGSGGFTGQVLGPAFAKTGARLKTVVSTKGVSGTQLGRKLGFENSSTDADSLFLDDDVNSIVITTRHDSHARFVISALASGKNVFVEKPLCIRSEELAQIEETLRTLGSNAEHSDPERDARAPRVMVGFNRRFAPQVVKMKSLLAGVSEPKAMIMVVNSGAIPGDHWIQDPEVGGGRLIGEGCHFIDLLRHLAGAPIVSSQVSFCEDSSLRDTFTITLGFEDGSTGTIHYFSNGNKGLSKERLEVFCGGRVLQLDNFRKLKGYGWKGFSSMNLRSQDKGHAAEARAFVDSIETGAASPIPIEEILEVTRVSLELVG